MNAMIDFYVAMLQTLAAFLGSEPVIYLFGMVVFCFLCKGIKTLIA
ncbi:hypothetical protein SDC9_182790 [bioreactor metagenome]|uniref:Uncharacterized protein n=1 Tax=bioreactor metagenome TaxID=1076179 RepID=A0A645HHZ6_9ZZZZ